MATIDPALLRGETLQFDSFALDRRQRLLLDAGEVVRIGDRALDLLTVLLERPGEVITKRELMMRAWPSTRVAEANLRVHLASLKRVLGNDPTGTAYIRNVAGEGYSFIGRVHAGGSAATGISMPARRPTELPTSLSRMIGRDAALAALVQQLPKRRIMTIVGAAGIGKTTLALAVAAQCTDRYGDGVVFLDLSAVSNPVEVAGSLAAALQVSIQRANPLPDLISYVAHKHLLIVLDNCEHVLSAAASLAEGLLRAAPRVTILATSREATRARGENLHPVRPLEIPARAHMRSVATARSFSAVQLFVERAMDSDQGFELNETNVDAVCDICRRLDGIPLALELAAACAGLLGVNGLAAALDRNILLSVRGRRTSAARHHTLGAAIAWSYELLSPREQLVLRRLSVLKSGFTLEAAAAVAAHGLDADQVIESVHGLVERSLISTDATGSGILHQLLNTTRAFAFERLAASTDHPAIFRWHADYLLGILEHSQAAWNLLRRSDWIDRYCRLISDTRAALEWAFSSGGDATLGVRLTLAAIPFGFAFGQLDELRERVEQSLRYLTSAASPDPRAESQLRTALAVLLANTHWGTTVSNARTTSAAISLDSSLPAQQQVQPLLMRLIAGIETGDYSGALASARQLGIVAVQCEDPNALPVAGRAMSQALHFAGHHRAAREQARRVLADPGEWMPLSYLPMTIDRRVSLRIILARSLWIEGFADQTCAMAAECLRLAENDCQLAECQALALAACPIALWRGESTRAAELTESLLSIAARYRLSRWHSYGRWYAAVARRPAPHPVRECATTAMDLLPGLQTDTVMTIAPQLLARDALMENMSDESWSAPERLRIQAELMLAEDGGDSGGRAAARLQRSLSLARAQGAFSWELRTAISLASLWQRQSHSLRARSLLVDTCSRLTEGHGVGDAAKAQQLITSLNPARCKVL